MIRHDSSESGAWVSRDPSPRVVRIKVKPTYIQYIWEGVRRARPILRGLAPPSREDDRAIWRAYGEQKALRTRFFSLSLSFLLFKGLIYPPAKLPSKRNQVTFQTLARASPFPLLSIFTYVRTQPRAHVTYRDPLSREIISILLCVK